MIWRPIWKKKFKLLWCDVLETFSSWEPGGDKEEIGHEDITAGLDS